MKFLKMRLPRSKVIQGSLWTFTSYGVVQLLRLISNIFLAQLLVPEYFGLMTLVMLVMQGLAMFSDIGLLPSIVQNREGNSPDFLNTAWTIQLFRGVVLWLLASALSVPFSILYEQPMLAQVIPVASLSAIISGLNSTKLATETRKLDFKKITIIEITSQILSVTTMIIWAVISPTVWALVSGGILGSLSKMLLSHAVLAGPMNKLLWDSKSVSSLVKFGKWIFISTVFHFLATQSDKIIFGKLISLTELGVYSIAVIFASVPFSVITQLSSRVVFPFFSRCINENGHIPEETYNAVSRIYMLIGTVVTAITFVAGPSFIKVLYDERYSAAADLVQLLVVGKWFEVVLGNVRGAALLSHGMPEWNSIASGLKLFFICILIYPIFEMYGFYAAVIGYGVTELFRYLVFVYANYRVSIGGFILEVVVTIIVWSSLIFVEYIIWHMEGQGYKEQYMRFLACFILIIASSVTGLSYLNYQLKER